MESRYVFLKELYNFRCLHLFVIFGTAYILMSIMTNTFIITNELFYSSLNDKADTNRISYLIEQTRRMQWINYPLLPIFLSLKWGIVAGAIYTTLYLTNEKTSFDNCLKIVILAEPAMILAAFAKTGYFLYVPPSSLLEVQSFFPLSIVQIFNLERLPSYAIFPLQQINLFEALYWTLLVTGVCTLFEKPISKALTIVFLSYGSLNLLWILLLTFINLQIT